MNITIKIVNKYHDNMMLNIETSIEGLTLTLLFCIMYIFN